jgi:hydrogenase maturation protein HypF
MLNKDVNAPITSSTGRLFDGVASILGIRQQISYEGQAAMELEFAIANFSTDAIYNFKLVRPSDQITNSPIIIDWQQIIKEILTDITNNLPLAEISAKFHNTLAKIIIVIAKIIGRKHIVLTGGCWQNKYLTERAIALLTQENFIPYWHHRIPCNDSGIALGQIIATVVLKRRE